MDIDGYAPGILMHPLYHLRGWLKTGLEKFKLMFDMVVA
jgi:hypothetical protein